MIHVLLCAKNNLAFICYVFSAIDHNVLVCSKRDSLSGQMLNAARLSVLHV